MAVYTRKKKDGSVSYFYKFTINGRTYWNTVKEAQNKRQAQRAEAEAREAIYRRKYRRPEASPALADFIAQTYLPWSRRNKRTAYDDALICDAIVAHFGRTRLDEITARSVRQFQQARRDTPTQRHGRDRSPATVNREMSVLSKILTLAVEEELIQANPCKGVRQLRPDSHVVRFMTREEEARLLPYLRNERAHLHALVVVAVNTGMRRGELFSLRRSQVSFETGTITLRRTKTGRGRVIPMNSAVRAVMAELTEGLKDDDHLFVNPATGGPYTEVRNGFRRACELAGVRGLRFHDLRHTFATRLAEAGVNPFRIAELMGHTSIQMTKRYAHASAEGNREAVEQIVPAGNRCGIVAKGKAGQGAGSEVVEKSGGPEGDRTPDLRIAKAS